jgi:hypothetical protein
MKTFAIIQMLRVERKRTSYARDAKKFLAVGMSIPSSSRAQMLRYFGRMQTTKMSPWAQWTTAVASAVAPPTGNAAVKLPKVLRGGRLSLRSESPRTLCLQSSEVKFRDKWMADLATHIENLVGDNLLITKPAQDIDFALLGSYWGRSCGGALLFQCHALPSPFLHVHPPPRQRKSRGSNLAMLQTVN